jgi:hypothetical protein
MKSLLGKISGKSMMVLCIAACALPFVLILAFGGQASLSWIGLLACVGMHIVMMKMMPGHKSCHGHDEKASEEDGKAMKSLPKPSSMDA